MKAHNLRSPRSRLANLALSPRQVVVPIRRAAHLHKTYRKFVSHSANPLSVRVFRAYL
jgi:hypothetical protein